MPDFMPVTLEQLTVLAVEHWRLTQALSAGGGGGGAARHALRKIGELLTAWQLEARSLDGMPYDAGLSALVIDRVQDARVPAGAEAIVETLVPLILYQGRVVKAAEVVVGVGPES